MKNSEAMTALRDAARNLGAGGADITNGMLYAALGTTVAETEERDRIRRRCNQLVRTGELERIRPGLYRYNPGAAPAQAHDKVSSMWRAVRSAAPGFAAQDVARVSGAAYNYAIKYLKFLETAGFLRRHGRSGNALLYCLTAQGRAQRQSPLPPKPIRDPFEEERRHVHELVGLFLLRDPYQPAVRNQIVESARAILARFDKEESDDGHAE